MDDMERDMKKGMATKQVDWSESRVKQRSPQIVDQEPIDSGLPSRKPVDSTMMRQDSITVCSLVVTQYFDVGKRRLYFSLWLKVTWQVLWHNKKNLENSAS